MKEYQDRIGSTPKALGALKPSYIFDDLKDKMKKK